MSGKKLKSPLDTPHKPADMNDQAITKKEEDIFVLLRDHYWKSTTPFQELSTLWGKIPCGNGSPKLNSLPH